MKKVLMCLGIVLLMLSGSVHAEPHWKMLADMEDLSEWEGPRKKCKGPDGSSAMMIPMGSGGSYEVILKTFADKGINISDYDVIKYEIKVEGGGISFDHPLRQWPFMGGRIAQYYPLDYFYRPPGWQTLTVNLREPENVWPTGYDKNDQLFKITVSGTADRDDLRFYIDNIRLVKRLIKVDCIDDMFLHFGEKKDLPNGNIEYTYPLRVTNCTDKKLPVVVTLDKSRIKHFQTNVSKKSVELPPKGSTIVPIQIIIPANQRKKLAPIYSETARAIFSVKGVEESEFYVDLLAAVPMKAKKPPFLSATADRYNKARQWMKKWKWAEVAAQDYIKGAEFAMQLPTDFPKPEFRKEQEGDKICPDCKEKTELYVIEEPRSMFRYQCTACGKLLSPKLSGKHSESGYWWHPDPKRKDKRSPRQAHAIALSRYGNIVKLAIAYQLTGEKKYAEKIAAAIRGYLKVYPDYPVAWRPLGYPMFGSKVSWRIGNFFQDYVWLSNMSVALDAIWNSGVLSSKERKDFINKVLFPEVLQRIRLEGYLIHRNNQIGGGIALLANNAPLLAFLLDDPRMGLRPHLRTTIHNDGFNYMAPQYQSTVMSTVLPVVKRYDNAGIDLYSQIPGLKKFFTSWYLWTDPDGNTPNLGDSTRCNYRHTLWYFEQGFNKFKNPVMAIPLQESLYNRWKTNREKIKWEDISRAGPFTQRGAVLLFGAENIPRNKPDTRRPSHNYPDYGMLIFNQGEGDKKLWAAIPYGPPMGHGHHDKLHLEWWALGQKMSRKSGGYAEAPSAPYWHQSSTHNTLVVDQQDMMNVAGKTIVFDGEGPVQGACLEHNEMYPGVSIKRTIVLYNGLIILYDTCSSEKEHTYDFVYRNAGTLHTDLKMRKTGKPLSNEKNMRGQSVGYSIFRNVEEADAPSLFKADWDNLMRPDAKVGMSHMQLSGPGKIIQADGPYDMGWRRLSKDTKQCYEEVYPNKTKTGKFTFYGPVLFSRQKGKTAAFLTILEPYTQKRRIAEIKLDTLKINGKTVPPEQGIALQIKMDGQLHYVIIAPCKGTKRYGKITTENFFDARYMGDLN